MIIKKALNGKLCIDKVEKYEKLYGITFDLIFMDINMPIMDGFTAAGELHKLSEENLLRDQYIIILSANIYNYTESKFSNIKKNYIKPIQYPVLENDLENLI